MAVDQVITRSVLGHLERSSYNSPGEVVEILGRLGMTVIIPPGLRKELSLMMSRRHLIAHQADRNPESGPGHQMARSISLVVLERWFKAVNQLGKLILAAA